MRHVVLAASAATVAVVCAAAFTRPADAQSSSTAGRWTHRGSQTELVITSSIRHQLYTPPGGFSLGGSVGAGSATNANIVTESTPQTVHRTMTLTIQPGGAFRWVTSKRQPDGRNCSKTIDQDRTGTVSTSGGRMAFSITGGTERTTRSCGGAPTQSAASRRTETYDFSLSGGSLRLTSGGTTWAFSRG